MNATTIFKFAAFGLGFVASIVAIAHGLDVVASLSGAKAVGALAGAAIGPVVFAR